VQGRHVDTEGRKLKGGAGSGSAAAKGVRGGDQRRGQGRLGGAECVQDAELAAEEGVCVLLGTVDEADANSGLRLRCWADVS